MKMYFKKLTILVRHLVSNL